MPKPKRPKLIRLRGLFTRASAQLTVLSVLGTRK